MALPPITDSDLTKNVPLSVLHDPDSKQLEDEIMSEHENTM